VKKLIAAAALAIASFPVFAGVASDLTKWDGEVLSVEAFNKCLVAEGLQEMSFTLHINEVESRSQLTDKASMTLAKLNKLATDNSRQLVVIMPKNTTKAVTDQIMAAAPNANLTMTGRSGQAVFKVLPLALEDAARVGRCVAQSISKKE